MLNLIIFSSKGQETKSADVLRTTKNTDEHDKYASMPQGSSHLTNNDDDEFDDFDPRGTSSASKYGAVDL